jgi:starch-binding outer membrane protein, SusD/RagB family
MKQRSFSIIKIMMAVVAILMTGSCKKYLDQQPITSVGSELVFKDVSTTYQALIAVYSRLTGDNGYGIRLSLYYPVDNDEMQGPSGGSDVGRRDIARYGATPSNSELERPFNQLFTGIEYANICIDQIPKMEMFNNGSDQEKKQLRRMLGEAYTLRAQFYFEAIRNWGDLPAHFAPAYALASADPIPGKTNRDTLYNRLLDDLRIATEMVPWRNEVGSIGDPVNERITKGTVKGLRARIALFRGGFSLRPTSGSSLGVMQRGPNHLAYYQIARDECNDIINSGQHGLNPSFKSLWKDQVGARAVADPHGELMFQVTGIGGGGQADTKLGYYNGPRANNNGNSSINPLPTYFYSFDPNDERLFVTIAPYNVNQNGTKQGLGASALNDGKYRRDWITPAISTTDQAQYFQTKWQILRYSDVLLMFAEAENELNGPTPQAYNAINMVRRRGFGKPIGTIDPTVDLTPGLSKPAFFDAIVRERSFELGGEGIRKYDLIRWNLLAAKIAETKSELAAFVAGTGRYANVPTRMFFKQNSFADDRSLWHNSFYAPYPPSDPAPAGTTAVNWRHSSVTTGTAARFASSFTPGRSELLPLPNAAVIANPNLKQNPGY